MINLLEKMGAIDFKYQKLKSSDNFNIFTILRNSSDEVHLHSKFIAELLNPSGSHSKGRLFLDLFLKICKLPSDITNPTIRKETQNIDILINSKDAAIIIENKIWATDQPSQLERYFNLIDDRKSKKVLYLTLDGRLPSENSIGTISTRADYNDILKVISYREEIDKWINECIKEASLNPALRETLSQYKKLINNLTGNNMQQEEKAEILKLIATNDNATNAYKIHQSWEYIKVETEYAFWSELEHKIEKEYTTILEVQRYSKSRIQHSARKKRGSNPWFGIMFEFGKISDFTLCLYIERGSGNLYYGLTILKNGKRIKVVEKEVEALAINVDKYCDLPKGTHVWFGVKYLDPYINFEDFQTSNTLKLVNETNRQNVVIQCWSDIKKFIEDCKRDLPITFQTL